MDNLLIFTERFNDILQEKQLKPSQLAAKLGVPKNTICRYARGAQLPNLKMAIMLCDYLCCDIDYLLGRSDKPSVIATSKIMPFADRFDFLLSRFKTNKYRIAKFTPLHASILYRWQSGECSPELDSLIILADYFDCSVEYVLGRSDKA